MFIKTYLTKIYPFILHSVEFGHSLMQKSYQSLENFIIDVIIYSIGDSDMPVTTFSLEARADIRTQPRTTLPMILVETAVAHTSFKTVMSRTD